MSFSPVAVTCAAGWSVRRCLRSMMPPVLCLGVRPGREGRLTTFLVIGEYVHRMLPELGNIRQRIIGILAVEEGRCPVQVFEAERIVDDLLDDNARHTIVIAWRQQGFHHGIAFTGCDHHGLTLRTLFPGWVRAVTAVGKQVEPLHELWCEI